MAKTLTINNQELLSEAYETSLSSSATATGTTLSVYSISNFAVNNILLIGEFGQEGSEVIKTHASTAPTGTTVTLASALVKSHPKDTKVYVIPYDQAQFYHATTATGDKTLLSTSDIDEESHETKYVDTAYSSGYYFVRFYNSITGGYSAYSDPIPYTGFEANTLGYAIETAMEELGAEFTEELTVEKLIRAANQMLRLVRGKLKAWSKYQSDEQNFGTLTRGVRRRAIPSDVYDQNSNRSILNLRAGDDTPLLPIDRSEYLQATENVVYTEVATEAAASDTELVLDDTSDLDDEGSVDVFVSGTKYTIEYTDNDRDTNTLTVEDDQITVTLPVDSPTWKNIEEGTPAYFSIWEGYCHYWPIIDSNYAGRNLTGDYHTDIETIDSQGDIIKGTKFDMLIPYLKYKIRAITDNHGKEDLKDPSYIEFRELLQDAIKNDGGTEIEAFRPRKRVVYGGRKHLSRR